MFIINLFSVWLKNSPGLLVSLITAAILMFPNIILAATLSVSPATGVYKTGSTFSVNVYVNTAGKAINASDGTLSFNPKELSVVSASRGSSIFNLWTTEPTFSNTAGTVNFSGGLPSGYTGASGNVMTVTFRSLTSGTARISLTGASVLAADGKGTNVLTNMSGGTYTLSAVESQPEPEVIVEYVAPANTPAAPVISTTDNRNQSDWSKNKDITFNWSLPSGVTAVRTSLDSSAVSVPTKVYDNPIKTLTINDLDEGVSYLHVQFKNADGWGKVAHFRVAVDSEKPEEFNISLPENADLSNPVQGVLFETKDKTSLVSKFKIQLDGAEPYEYVATTSSSVVLLPSLAPGYHTLVVEGFDEAGNSLVATLSLTITSFEKPVITDFPAELNSGVIPVIKGTTKPSAQVTATITHSGFEDMILSATADGGGIFTIIPEGAFTAGVYKVSVTAVDTYGAQSEPSDVVTINVSEPGYMVIGSLLINVLSVLIPLIALCVLTWIVLIYSVRKMSRLRSKVIVESEEASAMLFTEFGHIENVIYEQKAKIADGRKTKKLTKIEEELFSQLTTTVSEAKQRVSKEVTDVTKIFKK